ncbi:MAG: isochorismatase family protein, partial [Propionibacteriaceae bacterium]|nr:isochorismatase family protein [Propionibacteriaceae bacterium]
MKTALLVIDLQQDVVADCWDAAGVVARSWALVQRARREGVPVFWTQHEASGLAPGAPGWEFAPPLAPEPPEPVVHKRYRDAFAQTGLGDWLSDLEVTRLVVCGARSDHCVRATTHRA